MTNKVTRALNRLFEAQRDATPRDKASEEPELRRQLEQRLSKWIVRSLRTAFGKAGLDDENPRHRERLLWYFALAHYGGRSRGAPKKWSKKKRRRLRRDVEKMQQSNPGLTEKACCELLVDPKKGKAPYNRAKIVRRNNKQIMKASTLLRQLQISKRLELERQIVVEPRFSNQVTKAIQEDQSSR